MRWIDRAGTNDHESPTDSPTDGLPPWLRCDRRPHGVTDGSVEAVGKLSDACEWIERACGRLDDFHQMSGHADLLLGEAADALDEAGHASIAAELRDRFVGRNVIEGRWTFQIVDEYDATYWSPIRSHRTDVEAELMGGAQHVAESEMKEDRRTDGRRHQESRPRPRA